jgi:opacity protein-like surface antigen
MRKWLGLVGLLAIYCLPASAQITPKWEVGASFTYLNYYPPNSPRFALYGGNVTVERNFRPWIGLAVDGGAVYRNQGIVNIGVPPVATVLGKTEIFDVLAGPRIYPLRHRHKIIPFGQVLFGLGINHRILPANGGFPELTSTSTSFAWAGGGGVDYRLSPHWAVHAFEFDYFHTTFFGGNPAQGSYRISAGIVYRFGQRTAATQ